jgi:hypothetical protein
MMFWPSIESLAIGSHQLRLASDKYEQRDSMVLRRWAEAQFHPTRYGCHHFTEPRTGKAILRLHGSVFVSI